MVVNTGAPEDHEAESIVINYAEVDRSVMRCVLLHGGDGSGGKMVISVGQVAVPPAIEGSLRTKVAMEEARREFVAEGRNVPDAIHRRAFTDIAARLRVERSERSRLQAG
jgi:hypothetical protein